MTPEKKTPQEIFAALLEGEQTMRDYLRGIEPGSEADRDAQRAMLTAISALRADGVCDLMADCEPYLYAQACLLLCQAWSDTEAKDVEAVMAQYRGIMWQLRYDERNYKAARTPEA